MFDIPNLIKCFIFCDKHAVLLCDTPVKWFIQRIFLNILKTRGNLIFTRLLVHNSLHVSFPESISNVHHLKHEIPQSYHFLSFVQQMQMMKQNLITLFLTITITNNDLTRT